MQQFTKEHESLHWRRRQFLKLAGAATAGAVAAVTFPGLVFSEVNTDSSDYTIFIDKGQVKARNATGRIDFCGMDAGMVIQSAINALTGGGELFIRAGTYQPTRPTRIQIGSKVVVRGEGQASTILKAPNNLNTDFIRNLNQAGGNTDITIRDLTIDGNRANQANPLNGFGIYTRKVSGLSIQNVRVTEAPHFQIYIKDCDSADVSNVTVDGTAPSTAAGGQDGLHINSSRGVTVYGLVASTGDDALAINSDMDGECRDVVASRLYLNRSLSASGIHIYVAKNQSTNVRNVSISDFVIQDCCHMGIYIAQLNGANGQIQDISFSNGKIENPGWDGVRIDPGAAQSCTRVSLSDLTIRNAGNRGINFRGVNNIAMSNVQIYNTADGWQSLYLESCSNVTVTGGDVDYVSGSKTNKLDCVCINETSVSSVQRMTIMHGGTGIRIVGSRYGSNRNIIADNNIKRCKVGISIANAACTDNIIRNNQLLNNVSALNDKGTGTVIDNNVVLDNVR